MTPVEGLRVYDLNRRHRGIGYVAGVLTRSGDADTVVVEWMDGKITEEVWGTTVAPCRQ